MILEDNNQASNRRLSSSDEAAASDDETNTVIENECDNDYRNLYSSCDNDKVIDL